MKYILDSKGKSIKIEVQNQLDAWRCGMLCEKVGNYTVHSNSQDDNLVFEFKPNVLVDFIIYQ